MKKAILVLFIMISIIKAQNQPGVNYMPHISFFDQAVNYLSNPNNLATQTEIWDSSEAHGWYLDLLHNLGITNLVTDAQFHQNALDSYPKNFFLNDMGFAWKHDLSAIPPRSFLPAKYMNAFGHWREKFVLQLGGTYRSTISYGDNYGFGAVTNINPDASYWVLRPFQGQPTTELTGIDTVDGFTFPETFSRIAFRGRHTAGKPIVWAQLPSSQFPLNTSLKIRVYFRRSMTQGNVDLFTLRARGISPTASGAHTYAPRRDFFKTEVQSNTPLSEFVYVVNTQMLDSRHLTKYDSLDIGIIDIAKDNHFYFQLIGQEMQICILTG